MYKIRHSGKDLICASLDELELGIQTYKGQSVTIEFYPISKEHKRIFIVDVTEQGDVYSSYGPKVRIDLNAIQAL